MIAIVLRQRHPNEWPTPVQTGTPAAMWQLAYTIKAANPAERITVVAGQEQEVSP